MFFENQSAIKSDMLMAVDYVDNSPVEKVIYNCHSHIFTHENIPDRYFPLRIVQATRFKPVRWVLGGMLKQIVPFTSNDMLNRCANFVNYAYNKSQEDNLQSLIGLYPSGTRFVILPMDMTFMGASAVKEGIDVQHQELARLANNEQYKDVIIPFAHIDPRHPNALDRLKYLVEHHNFRGVKIYPSLGYPPGYAEDEENWGNVLMNEIYPYMVEKNIPLIAHCSPGSVNNKQVPRKKAQDYGDPEHYTKVMKKHPDLRICLSHFGGITEWQKYLNHSKSIENPTWLEKICDMMRDDKYQNLYADISYTVFNFQENITLLQVLLEDEKILPKVLFGSDFYMTANERYPERRLSIDLRAILGERLFWQIANKNPKTFLAEK